VLTYSPRKAYTVYTSNDLYALMDGHEQAFGRFGGCAHRCTYDSQKPVVSRWEGTQPIYNPLDPTRLFVLPAIRTTS
jgi:transposase